MYKNLCQHEFAELLKKQKEASEKVGTPTIKSKEKRNAFIKSIENNVKLGTSVNRFHLFFNAKEGRITWSSSIEEYTGYSNRSLTLYDTLNWVHPAYYNYYTDHAIAAYQLMSETKIRKEQYRYIIKFKLIKSDRKTIIDVMQTSTPLIFDENGIMIAHFNEYQIIGHGETRISLSTPMMQNKNVEVPVLKTKLANYFKGLTSINISKYKPGHIYVMGRYADTPNITAQQMADSGILRKNTINKYNAEIIEKTKEFLDTEIHGLYEARDIAIVYRDLGLI